jgi:hypothetical protein
MCRARTHRWLAVLVAVSSAFSAGCGTPDIGAVAKFLQASDLRLAPVLTQEGDGTATIELANDRLKVGIVRVEGKAAFEKAVKECENLLDAAAVSSAVGTIPPDWDYALFTSRPLLIKVYPASAAGEALPILEAAAGKLKAHPPRKY